MQRDESRLASLARQYDWLRARGESHEDSLAHLHSNIDQDHQALLQRLLNTTSDSATTSPRALNHAQDPLIGDMLGSLGHVLDHASTPLQRSALVMGGAALNAHFSQIGATLREQAITRYSYMTYVCLAGLIVSTIYAMYVQPNMEFMRGLMANAGGTKQTALFDLGMYGYPVLFLILFAISGLVYVLSLRSSYRLGSAKAFAAPLHRLPGLRSLNRMLNHYVSLCLYALYRNSDFSSEQSRKMALKNQDDVAPDVLESLSLAETLGTHDQELDYQRGIAQSTLETTIDKTTSTWHRGFTVVVALVTLAMLMDYYGQLFFGYS